MNKVTLLIYAFILLILLVVSEIVIHWQKIEDSDMETTCEIVVVKVVDNNYRIVQYDGELYWQSRNHNYINGDYWIMGGKLK